MAHITLMAICDGIAATFDGTPVTLNAGPPAVSKNIIARSYNNLHEGMIDQAVLQIWPILSITDSANDIDRTTFKGCVKHGEYTFIVRAFARQRAQSSDDMEAVINLWDVLEEILEDEGTDCPDSPTGDCDYFGVAGIQYFAWTGGAPWVIKYAGAEWVGVSLELRIGVY